MEKKSNPLEGDQLQLANRKCLLRLLSFLDSKLPVSCAVHSLVNAAVSTENPAYRVYFRRQHVSTTSTSLEDEFSLVVAIGMERFINSRQETKKSWFLSAWTNEDDGMLADAYKAIDIIDWSLDIVVMHHKNHAPHPTISHFIASKQTMGHCYPCDQYVLSRKNAVHLQIREMDGVYVKSLERCHAQTVYDYWPYNEGTTVENVAKEIEELPSAGVFLTDNDKLMSWMMSHPPNGMSRLHTLQEYRRRGYAALVTRSLSKRVA
ncbi:hypothetical protein DAPPUDRAFT_308592 [Daphnia pulex]|uniref:GCN5-related N-acetyltransferase Rv2170-like domain-containing protein n=1 Tax=Daphnia pulex TaxID=6669 RepID=E9H886_DAPPU|nr:hypothetical protein DAPPUDRAFT_308592 [Daphnia pulex]|eukprot:EFX72028.1 hypothetical protein DAPPUDRAFT_308592 [Daphnia pulex]